MLLLSLYLDKNQKTELDDISGIAIMQKTENKIQCKKIATQEAKVETFTFDLLKAN